MDKKRDLLGIILASTVGIAILSAMLIRAFQPQIIIPKLDASAVVLLSVIALLIDYYFVKMSRRVYTLIPLYAALIFGIFPWVGCFMSPINAVISALLGAVIFTVVTFVFDSIINRMSISKATKIAPLVVGFGIYLSSQCLIGII